MRWPLEKMDSYGTEVIFYLGYAANLRRRSLLSE